MADTHVTRQTQHMAGMKHIAHQTVVLAQVQTAVFTGHDARRILAAVLQYRQAVIQSLIHRVLSHNANDSTHLKPPFPSTATTLNYQV